MSPHAHFWFSLFCVVLTPLGVTAALLACPRLDDPGEQHPQDQDAERETDPGDMARAA